MGFIIDGNAVYEIVDECQTLLHVKEDGIVTKQEQAEETD